MTSATTLTTTQRAMLALTFLLIPLSGCLFSGVVTMRKHNALFHSSAISSVPQPLDLAIAVVFALVLAKLRAVLVVALKLLARRALPPATRTSEYRVERFATSIFKLLYFACTTIVGFLILKDEPWFPSSLGGAGRVTASFSTVSQPPTRALRLYMLVEFAYQTHSLIFVLLYKPFDGDTMDFVVHDLTAMLLISSAYATNYLAYGAVIAFLNDACDVIQYAFFLASDSRRTGAIAPLYAIFLVGWWYTRLYVFPLECLRTLMEDAAAIDPHVSIRFLFGISAMLVLLLGLQAYWYALFALKGFRILRKATRVPPKVQ